MGKVATKIEEDDLHSLNDHPGDVAVFLTKYLLDRKRETFKQVCEQLQDYYKDEGGSPLVLNFQIVDTDCSFDAASGRGKAALNYAVQYHFGCSDLSPTTNITDVCDFFIDEINSLFTLYLPDKVLRDTIDEF